MNNSILIGKTIYNVLSNNEELKAIVEDKIFPLVANTELNTYPFIVYSRTGIVPSYNKDGITEDTVSIVIYCVSDDYVQSLDMANLVRNTLECRRLKDGDLRLSEIHLSGISEDYYNDVYMQVLTFEIKAC